MIANKEIVPEILKILRRKEMRLKESISVRKKGAVFALIFIWILLAFIKPIPARSEGEIPAIKIGLTDAVETALRDNHEVKAQKNAVLSQKSDVGVARSIFLPKLSFEERYSLTTNPSYAFMNKLNQADIEQQDFNPDTLNHPDSTGDYQTSFTIEQAVYAQKSFIGYAISKREAKAKEKDFKRKKEDIAYQVLKTYLNVSSTKEYTNALRKSVGESEENLRIANLRYNNGLGQYADTLRSITELNQARQRLNNAEKNLYLARNYLALLLAVQADVDVRDEKVHLDLKEIDYYVLNAQSRSDILSAEFRRQNAKDSVSMAKSGYLPFLGVGGSYQMNDSSHIFGDEGTSWQVGAFLRWDIFDGAKREYEIGKAKYQEMQASESVASMRQAVSFRIRESYLNVQEAVKNIELAKMSLDSASEGARLIRVRYANGLAALDDLLSAQSALERARASIVEQDNAYLSAIGTLGYESGTILDDLNIKDSDGE